MELFFGKFEGTEGLIKKLGSSFEAKKKGISKASVPSRQEYYGKNVYVQRAIKSMSSRLVDSLGDNMLKILMVGAIVSIVVGVS